MRVRFWLFSQGFVEFFFFFKQKTAYEIGTGDWSSDVCSSDLEGNGAAIIDINFGCPVRKVVGQYAGSALMREVPLDRKSVV